MILRFPRYDTAADDTYKQTSSYTRVNMQVIKTQESQSKQSTVSSQALLEIISARKHCFSTKCRQFINGMHPRRLVALQSIWLAIFYDRKCLSSDNKASGLHKYEGAFTLEQQTVRLYCKLAIARACRRRNLDVLSRRNSASLPPADFRFAGLHALKVPLVDRFCFYVRHSTQRTAR
jgi:hypothetical protein